MPPETSSQNVGSSFHDVEVEEFDGEGHDHGEEAEDEGLAVAGVDDLVEEDEGVAAAGVDDLVAVGGTSDEERDGMHGVERGGEEGGDDEYYDDEEDEESVGEEGHDGATERGDAHHEERHEDAGGCAEAGDDNDDDVDPPAPGDPPQEEEEEAEEEDDDDMSAMYRAKPYYTVQESCKRVLVAMTLGIPDEELGGIDNRFRYLDRHKPTRSDLFDEMERRVLVSGGERKMPLGDPKKWELGKLADWLVRNPIDIAGDREFVVKTCKVYIPIVKADIEKKKKEEADKNNEAAKKDAAGEKGDSADSKSNGNDNPPAALPVVPAQGLPFFMSPMGHPVVMPPWFANLAVPPPSAAANPNPHSAPPPATNPPSAPPPAAVGGARKKRGPYKKRKRKHETDEEFRERAMRETLAVEMAKAASAASAGQGATGGNGDANPFVAYWSAMAAAQQQQQPGWGLGVQQPPSVFQNPAPPAEAAAAAPPEASYGPIPIRPNGPFPIRPPTTAEEANAVYESAREAYLKRQVEKIGEQGKLPPVITNANSFSTAEGRTVVVDGDAAARAAAEQRQEEDWKEDLEELVKHKAERYWTDRHKSIKVLIAMHIGLGEGDDMGIPEVDGSKQVVSVARHGETSEVAGGGKEDGAAPAQGKVSAAATEEGREDEDSNGQDGTDEGKTGVGATEKEPTDDEPNTAQEAEEETALGGTNTPQEESADGREATSNERTTTDENIAKQKPQPPSPTAPQSNAPWWYARPSVRPQKNDLRKELKRRCMVQFIRQPKGFSSWRFFEYLKWLCDHPITNPDDLAFVKTVVREYKCQMEQIELDNEISKRVGKKKHLDYLRLFHVMTRDMGGMKEGFRSRNKTLKRKRDMALKKGSAADDKVNGEKVKDDQQTEPEDAAADQDRDEFKEEEAFWDKAAELYNDTSYVPITDADGAIHVAYKDPIEIRLGDLELGEDCKVFGKELYAMFAKCRGLLLTIMSRWNKTGGTIDLSREGDTKVKSIERSKRSGYYATNTNHYILYLWYLCEENGILDAMGDDVVKRAVAIRGPRGRYKKRNVKTKKSAEEGSDDEINVPVLEEGTDEKSSPKGSKHPLLAKRESEESYRDAVLFYSALAEKITKMEELLDSAPNKKRKSRIEERIAFMEDELDQAKARVDRLKKEKAGSTKKKTGLSPKKAPKGTTSRKRRR